MSTIIKEHTKTRTKAKTKAKLDNIDKKQKISDIVCKFNMVIKGMINHITQYHDDTTMSSMNILLQDIIDKTPEEPISCFIMNIYKNDDYRTNILKQNDKFFMEEEYDDFVSGDDERTTKLFEFKELWQKIDDDTKQFIKKSMMGLVKISQQYILTL
jgi:hypothetical protein